MAFCLIEFMLHRQSGIFREYAAVFLSLQWMLLACLAIWCGTFLFLTFSLKDWPLMGLLLIVIIFYFVGYSVYPSRDALTLLAGVTLGRGASFALKEDGRWKMEDGKNKLAIRHPQSAILIFLTELVLLLAVAAWWRLDMSDSYYHGPRWMGLWDNPNTYGMLMGAGSVLAVGLLTGMKKEECRMQNSGKAESGKLESSLQPSSGLRPPSPAPASEGTFLRSFVAIKSAVGNWQSAMLLVAVGMLGVGLVMSYSRGAWLATSVGLLYLAWCYGKLKWRHIVICSSVLVLGAGVLWGRTLDSAPWYVKRADLGRPSAQNRATAWRAGLEILRDHPLGVGWNNATKIYGEKYHPPEGGPAALTTNDYLMIGTELGIPALLCFVAYVGLCYRRSPRPLIPAFSPGGREGVRRTDEGEALRAACLAGALVFVVAFWFDGGLFKLPTAAMFWVLLELGSVCCSRTASTPVITNA
jgi:O-antigen ligase